MTPGSFDIERMLRVLDEHGVQYVVVGGIAGRLHGSPTVTQDLDICYERSDDNLERLAAALRDLGAHLRGAPDDVPVLLDAKTLKAGGNFTFNTSAGALDVLAFPSGTNGYPSLASNAEELDLDGVIVRVASLDDLIRMKLAAGRAKDRIEVEVLTAIRDRPSD